MTLPASRDGERGIALILVLWGLALIAAIAIAVGSVSRTETFLARNAVENARARHAAEAGFHHGLRRLLDAQQGPEVRFDGTPYPLALGDTQLRIAILDEGGRVDLNAAPPEMIATLLLAMGVGEGTARRLADAILDWRDEDDRRRADGAEAAEYRALGLPYGPRNGPFETVQELRLVLGMTDAVYERLAPHVTVHSGTTGIDPAVATRAALLAVPGISENQVEQWLASRRHQREARFDPGLGIATARRYLSSSASQSFAIAAEAMTASGARHRVEGVILLTQRPDRPYVILSWRG